MKNNKGLANPSTLGNYMSNIVLEQIRHVLRNLVQTYNINKTYIEKDELWSDILTVTGLEFCLKSHKLKGYSQYQFVKVRDIINKIKHTMD